jgi:hypothetical protein
MVLAPSVEWTKGRLLVQGSGLYSWDLDRYGRSEGLGNIRYGGGLGAGFLGHLDLTGAWTDHRVGPGAWDARLTSTLERRWRRFGVAADLSLGHLDGTTQWGYGQARIRSYVRIGGIELSGETGRTVRRDLSAPGDLSVYDPSPTTSSIGGLPDTLIHRILSNRSHVAFNARFERGIVELAGGVARWFAGVGPERTTWQASGVLWLQHGLGLRVAAGQSPLELASQLPSRSYFALGFRFGSPRAARRPSVEDEVSMVAAAFLVQPERSDTVAISIRREGTDRVELSGDFTDWQPVALAATGSGRWVVRLPVRPGIHQVNVRFGGGPWQVPEGLASVDDEFGGSVGVFVVQ